MTVKEYIDEHAIHLQFCCEEDDFVYHEDLLLPKPRVLELIRNVKQELIDKACEWIYQQQLTLDNQEQFIADFSKAMEKQ